MAEEGLPEKRASFFFFFFVSPRCSFNAESLRGWWSVSLHSLFSLMSRSYYMNLVGGWHFIFQGVVGIFSWVTASRPHDLVPIMVYLPPLLSCLSLVDIVS